MAFDLISGLVAAAAAALGGALTSNASSNAADTQSDAARAAAAVSSNQNAQTRADLLPYNRAGQDSLAALHALMGLGPNQNPLTSPLLAPFGMNQAALEATPGYQFTRDQGLKAINNSAVSKGLTGNALRGYANFTTGLADNTYGQQFARYLEQQNAISSKLGGMAGMGQNAAAQTGTIGANLAGQTGSNLVGAGTASAAGQIGSASALSGIPNNLLTNYLGMQQLDLINAQTGMYNRAQR